MPTTIHKTLNLDDFLHKPKWKNLSYSLLDAERTGVLMIPVSTLYDEYIDRPKLTEQKKPV